MFGYMSGMKYYASLDLVQGYHQVPMTERAKEYTSFITPDGQFQWTRMPFGTRNSPSHFQCCMQIVLADYLYKCCIVFVDDILIWGKDKEDFLSNLRNVLDALRKAKVVVSGPKTILGVHNVKYLGMLVDAVSVRITDKKKQGLLDMQPPTNVSELKSYLGLTSYFRAFVPNLSKKAFPLTMLLKKGAEWTWGPEQQTAFQGILDDIVNSGPLAQIQEGDKLILQTDASTKGLGAVLLAERGGKRCPVTYISQATSETQAKLSANELESLAIVWAVTKLRQYLIGTLFEIETDHKNLTFIERTPNNKILRWRLTLQEYDFVIRHILGTHNNIADALSRVGHSGQEHESLHTEPPAQTVAQVAADSSSSTHHQNSESAPETVAIREGVGGEGESESETEAERENGSVGPGGGVDPEAAPLHAPTARQSRDAPRLLTAEQLQRLLPVGEQVARTSEGHLCIPGDMRDLKLHLLKTTHGGLAGHYGRDATLRRLRDGGVTWDGIKTDVGDYVAGCLVCQKARLHQAGAALTGTTAVTEAWQSLAIDLIGPIRTAPPESGYIVTMQDRFSRFVELVAIEHKDAQSIAAVLNNIIFGRYGVPASVLSDRGKEFDNQLMETLAREKGFVHLKTLPYHPQSNGCVERVNKEIESALRTRLLDRRNLTLWRSVLPEVMYAINNSVNRATGFTPMELLFGRRLGAPGPTVLETAARQDVSADSFPTVLESVQSINSVSARACQEAVIAKRLAEIPDYRPPVVGEYRWLLNPGRRPSKVHGHYRGPYRVVAVHGYKVTLAAEDPRTALECEIIRHACMTRPVIRRGELRPPYSDEEMERLAQADQYQVGVVAILCHRRTPRVRGRPTQDNTEVAVYYEDGVSEWQTISSLPADLEQLTDYMLTHPELAAAVGFALVGDPVAA
ncbi:hypothetical protein KIPB_009248, partial [Kipferlia bialata]|eukprot:g9248.t1